MNRIVAVIVCVALLIALPAAAAVAEEPQPVELAVVAKLDAGQLGAVDEIVGRHGADARPLIASRGVFAVTKTAVVKLKDTEKKSKELAKDLAKDERVMWAEPRWADVVGDTRFHRWLFGSYGRPMRATEQALEQWQALDALELDAVHRLATGAGVTVAILDTGVDASHPLLADKVVAGYDMVDDDATPSDESNGVDEDGDGRTDEGYGHGTFVAGVVAQVAPSASILPVRVLDSEGGGELHSVLEGIDYAIAAGADVVNLSFGAANEPSSKLFKRIAKRARKAGVVMVAAAGNDAGEDERYPASQKEVISVTAADAIDEPLQLA